MIWDITPINFDPVAILAFQHSPPQTFFGTFRYCSKGCRACLPNNFPKPISFMAKRMSLYINVLPSNRQYTVLGAHLEGQQQTKTNPNTKTPQNVSD